jgi:ABC-type glycerol-3-phosphate transport system substrate-binding protein
MEAAMHKPLTLALVALVSLGAAACSQSTPTSTGAVTINVLVEGGGYGSQIAIAKAFEIVTGNKVNFVQVDYQGVYDKLSAEVASKSGAFDVATIDEVWISAFAKSVVPLDSLFTSAVKADLFPSLVSDANQGGHFVGMPTWANTEVLFYRKDLFSDAKEQSAFKAKYGYDLKPPTTWQSFRDAAQFFTRRDATGKATLYGTSITGAEDTDFELLALQAGSPGVVLDANGKSIIANPQHVQALEFLAGLHCNLNATPPNVSSQDWGATSNLFSQGQAAMIFFWGHNYRYIPTDAPAYGKIGVAPMIGGTAGIAGIPGPWFNVIPQSSKHQSVATQFVKFQYDHQDLAMTAPLGLVARPSVFAAVSAQAGSENIQPLLTTLAAPATRPRPMVSDWQKIVDSVIIPSVQSAVSCKEQPADILAKAQKQLVQMGH